MGDMCIVEAALPLCKPARLNSLPYLGRGDAIALSPHLLVGDRYFNVQVDAVEERSADLAEILLDLCPGTAAFARAVAVESTAATVQLSTERT